MFRLADYLQFMRVLSLLIQLRIPRCTLVIRPRACVTTFLWTSSIFRVFHKYERVSASARAHHCFTKAGMLSPDLSDRLGTPRLRQLATAMNPNKQNGPLLFMRPGVSLSHDAGNASPRMPAHKGD